MNIFKRISLYIAGVVSALAIGAQSVLAESAEKVAEHGAEVAEVAEHASESGGHHAFGIIFLMMAVVLLAGKLGNLVEKFKQPAVIGELLAGVALSLVGYLALRTVGGTELLPGLGNFIGDIRGNEVIAFIAELGVVILLFTIGLESNIKEMVKVGPRALGVALIGAILPFVLGVWVLGPIFFGDEEFISRLFLGAALVATSVGIPASVYKSLGKTKMHAFKTFLGATVIDDVLGLVVLAVVSALAQGGDITVGLIAELTGKSFGFLILAIGLGQIFTAPISKAFSKINTGIGMKIALAMTFALVFAYLADLVGLAPIVGAFAAGLLLDPIHFKDFEGPLASISLRKLKGLDKEEKDAIQEMIHEHEHTHVEDLIGTIGLIFIPIFFVYTGLQIEIESLLNPELYVAAVTISVVAFFAKFVAGAPVAGTRNEKMLVGVSMVPRGEVGLIFAATGLGLGAITPEIFSTIVLVVMFTTFIAPPIIRPLIARIEAEQREAKKAAK